MVMQIQVKNKKSALKVLDCTNAYPNAAPMNGAVQVKQLKLIKLQSKMSPMHQVLLRFSSFVKLLPKSISVKG